MLFTPYQYAIEEISNYINSYCETIDYLIQLFRNTNFLVIQEKFMYAEWRISRYDIRGDY